MVVGYEQALAALRVISGEIGGDLGARKIEQLRRNSNRFREGLFQAIRLHPDRICTAS